LLEPKPRISFALVKVIDRVTAGAGFLGLEIESSLRYFLI